MKIHFRLTIAECYRRSIRWNLIGSLNKNCFLDDQSSFSISIPSTVRSNYDLFFMSSGECLQIIDFHLYLTKLSSTQRFVYRLQDNSIEGIRSSYFVGDDPYFMSSTLLNDETSVSIRFSRFSASEKENFSTMISSDPCSPNYFSHHIEKIVVLSSSSTNYNSSLRIKTGGPCCYSSTQDYFAINIDNVLNVYDFRTFRQNHSIRVPIHRVTLSDVKFSRENPNVIFTTNGNQFQQWDIRQSHRVQAQRLPISCSVIKPLKTKFNSVLVSSFDERIKLIDLRYPTKPMMIYDFLSPNTNNPHFTFSIDHSNEHYIGACSQQFVANIWDLHSGDLLNRFLCPIQEHFVHTPSRCALTSIDNQPVMAIYHPEYSRLNRWR